MNFYGEGHFKIYTYQEAGNSLPFIRKTEKTMILYSYCICLQMHTEFSRRFPKIRTVVVGGGVEGQKTQGREKPS